MVCSSTSSFLVLASSFSCPVRPTYAGKYAHNNWTHAVCCATQVYYLCLPVIYHSLLSNRNGVTIATQDVFFFVCLFFFHAVQQASLVSHWLECRVKLTLQMQPHQTQLGHPLLLVVLTNMMVLCRAQTAAPYRPCMCIWMEIHFVCQQLWLY